MLITCVAKRPDVVIGAYCGVVADVVIEAYCGVVPGAVIEAYCGVVADVVIGAYYGVVADVVLDFGLGVVFFFFLLCFYRLQTAKIQGRVAEHHAAPAAQSRYQL